ncbi:MAG: hypothetical protein A3F68_12710 [Acidobacteria bacterium RIFCSPLOWO2_12_FULL_54_10]|nr:MAG: hypothetical protein A3F68_12710 [Acidobacteria bacterium RIFCSPLOWO2_12_FULL_54_10]
MNIAWYFFFFLVSGFCSLVYEVVWLRLAMAKFGVTTPMVSVVLSVFMAGLALGSLAGGAIARRTERRGAALLLRLYGAVELLIGLAGLLVPHLLNLVFGLMKAGAGQLVWDSASYYLLSGACVVVSLLPWCTAMGATFPLAMAAIRSTSSLPSERSFSFLYLSNVLGAILGTIIPAFLLIELWGFQSTLHLASSFNILIAGTVLALSFTVKSLAPPEPATSVAEIQSQPRLYDFAAGGSLWLLFITGLCTMAMEVVWIRQFSVYLGNVVYAFVAILAVYLAATWMGSFLYRNWARTNHPRESVKAWTFLGILALLPLLLIDPALPIKGTFLGAVLRTAVGIGPLSAALGFLTPLLVDHYSAGDPARAGRAYSLNIVGGIAGPLLCGFLILPLLGDRWGLVVLSIPLFVIGLFAVIHEVPQAATFLATAASKPMYAITILLAFILVTYTNNYQASFTDRVEMRDYMATVVAANDNGQKRLLINGIGMTTLSPITKYMAHLPLAYLSRPAQNGLIICFGMGTTFRSMLSWGIDTTVVELNPSVPKLFPYFHADAAEVVMSPLAHIVVDDGRRFLERSSEQYDVITIDPPPPISTPTTSLLYSSEFYAVAKKRLRPGGILHAWLAIRDPGWDLSTQTAFAKALRDSFPYIRVFPSLGGWGFHMLASETPIPAMDAVSLAQRMSPQAAADFVEWNSPLSPTEMFASILQKEQQITRLASTRPGIPAIQDDRPINEYFLLRRMLGPFP